jgi:hypothetical protein
VFFRIDGTYSFRSRTLLGGTSQKRLCRRLDRQLLFIAVAEHNRFGKATHRVGQEQFSNVGDCVSDIRSAIGTMRLCLDPQAAVLRDLRVSIHAHAFGLFILRPSCNRCTRESTICPRSTKVGFSLGGTMGCGRIVRLLRLLIALLSGQAYCVEELAQIAGVWKLSRLSLEFMQSGTVSQFRLRPP